MSVSQWIHIQHMPQRGWVCGYCGLNVANNLGYYKSHGNQHAAVGMRPEQIGASTPQVLICPSCEKPTFFEGYEQTPEASYGNEVEHLPPGVAGLYKEARDCIRVSAFTASVLATRKLLMNVAVTQGAEANGSFQSYVNYLATNGYVPPNARAWVDHIRQKGNEATHEIPPISENDAKELITFMEMILRLVFDFPNRIPRP